MKTPLQTMAQIDKLSVPGVGQALYWDTNDNRSRTAIAGFGVRVTASGHKAYVVQARVNGASRRVVLGSCDLLALVEARKRAKGALTKLQIDGIDITAAKRAKVAEEKAKAIKSEAQRLTLREAMEQYLTQKRSRSGSPLKASSQRDVRRHVTKNFADWCDEPVANIKGKAVRTRFAELQARGAVQQAKQAMAVLRALLNWIRGQYATDEDEDNPYPVLQVNPVQLLAKSGAMQPPEPRERIVPVDKVQAVWKMLTERRGKVTDRSSASLTTLDVAAFAILTGCRIGEATKLTWKNVNLEERWWRIPADLAKDGKERHLPLSTAALELLKSRPRRDKCRYVFPNKKKGDTHAANPVEPMKKISAVAGLHVSVHDMRRTFMAVAIECRVEKWRYELLTSHKPTDVTGRYYVQMYDVRYLRDDAETVGRWITAT